MELADLVALSRLPLSRGRLSDAARLADAVDGRLITALDCLGTPESHVELQKHAAAALDLAGRTNIRTLAWDSPDYPSLLKAIADPPLVLWVKGIGVEWSLPAVAVIGARAAAPASLDIARELGEGLAHAGVTVVSGLARGCDG